MRIVKLLQLIPYRFFYLLGLTVFIAGMPFNNLLMSQGQFIIAGTWLLSGIAHNTILSRIKAYFNNKQALALLSIYLLLIVGMLYTQDYSWGLKDLRIKLPLFLMPFLVIGLGPLTEKEYKGLLGFFVIAVTTSTLAGYWHYSVTAGAVYEPRHLSPFISHIRLSLLIIMALFTAGWLAVAYKRVWITTLAIVIGAWLLFFMYKLESFTGFGILLATAVVVLTVHLYRLKKPFLRYLLPLVIVAIGIVFLAYTYRVYENYFTPKALAEEQQGKLTAQGHPYDTIEIEGLIENGNYIWGYVCKQELETEWPKIGHIAFDSVDAKGQPVYYTLLRYMTSKNLHKDAEGLHKLSKADIQNVEAGIANAGYLEDQGLKARLHKVFWEYQVYKTYHNPSGHSVFMRWEFWRTAWDIINDHPVLGVGTGDVPNAFATKYEERKTRLSPEWRLRAHNQYLEIGVALGFIGIAVLLFSMLYPFITGKGYKTVLFTAFMVTAMLSMLTEDTLETQAGVSFYIFFFSLFLFLTPKEESNKTS